MNNPNIKEKKLKKIKILAICTPFLILIIAVVVSILRDISHGKEVQWIVVLIQSVVSFIVVGIGVYVGLKFFFNDHNSEKKDKG